MSMANQTSGRTVLLYPADEHAVRVTTHRLLQDLGHDVTFTTGVEEVLAMLRQSPADLLIVDESWRDVAQAPDRRSSLISKIGDLPAACRPRAVAIFADDSEADAPAQPGLAAPGSRVHVFIKPYHIHGLLALLRKLAKDAPDPEAPTDRAQHRLSGRHQIA